MFFILSKVLGFLTSPFYWILGSLIIFLITKNRKWALTCVCLFIFFSNQFIYSFVVSRWALDLVPVAKLEKHDIAIVLGGAARLEKLDTNRVFLNENSGDRIMHAIHLYKTCKVKKILFSGGAGSLFGEKLSEAVMVKKLFISLGIKENDLILESDSRNTYENAKFTSEILKRDYPNQKYLLVTNAIHQRRGIACFEKQGIACTPFPVDNENGFDSNDYSNFILPKSYVLIGWDRFFHEFTGYLSYKLKRYC